MSNTQSWILVIEVGVIALAYLIGLINKSPRP